MLRWPRWLNTTITTTGTNDEVAWDNKILQHQQEMQAYMQAHDYGIVQSLQAKLQKIIDTQPVDLASYVLQAKAHLLKAVNELDVAITGFQDSPATVRSFTDMVHRMQALREQLMKAAEFGMEEGKK